jgi:hypothetical protein
MAGSRKCGQVPSGPLKRENQDYQLLQKESAVEVKVNFLISHFRMHERAEIHSQAEPCSITVLHVQETRRQQH